MKHELFEGGVWTFVLKGSNCWKGPLFRFAGKSDFKWAFVAAPETLVMSRLDRRASVLVKTAHAFGPLKADHCPFEPRQQIQRQADATDRKYRK